MNLQDIINIIENKTNTNLTESYKLDRLVEQFVKLNDGKVLVKV